MRGDKNAILGEHEHIAVGVIFIENNEGKFLIQKTSKEKGGEFSSTGGHIDSGETPEVSIRREVEEELGINVDNDNIVSFGFLSFDMPLRYLFYLKKNIDLNDVKVQKEEVDYVEYMSVDKINKLIESGEMLKSHGIMFKELLNKKR
ncbi:MAG: NUDIX domain-containing protein [Bacilli bacterium]|nr:NUDIX domain-containing protein [Bacilli bacterium]